MSSVYRLTLRSLLRGRRAIALLLAALAPAALALAWVAVGGDDRLTIYAVLTEQVFVPTVVAVVALVLGASAIGDDRDDGTILYLAATPLSRRRLVIAKWLAGWTATALVCLPGLIACVGFALGGSGTPRAWAFA